MTLQIALMLLIAFPAGNFSSLEPASNTSTWLQYEDPEQAGWSRERLEAAGAFAEEIGSAALMVVYRGRVLLARGHVDGRYDCHSVRKSILSALYGIYVDAGLVDLDKTIGELGVDDRQALSQREKGAVVRDLIKARSGIYHPAAKEPQDMTADRPERDSHAPGAHFWYNNWDFNTAGVILEKLAGIRIPEAFKEKLADPLGMEDFRLTDGYYQYERSRTNHPAHGFKLSARDLARFGQLFLQEGVWQDQRILSKSWIEESVTLYSNVGDNWGYGYMWWVYQPGFFPDHPELNAFAAQGTGGQVIFVIPKLDLVVVNRGDTNNQRHVRGRHIIQLLGKIFEAKAGDPIASPKLIAMSAKPFAGALPAPVDRIALKAQPSELKAYAGIYQVESGPKITVQPHDDFLICVMEGQGEADFFMEAKDRFFAKTVNVQVLFLRNETGAVDRIEIDLFGQKIPAIRVE